MANVENFKNHPSVIIWSLGNECGGRGKNFIDATERRQGHRLDAGPVHYERFGIGPENPADIDSQMYGTPPKFERDRQRPASSPSPSTSASTPTPCSTRWARWPSTATCSTRCPAIVGGAIWEWEDQGLWNRRDPKHPILAYGGGFGEVPNDHYFIHKGVVSSDRSPKPHYAEMKRAYQWIGIEPVDLAAGTVKIRNKYQFINLTGFDAGWTVSEDGVEIQQARWPCRRSPRGTEVVITLPFEKFDAQGRGRVFPPRGLHTGQ